MRFLILSLILLAAFGAQAQTNPLGSEYQWVPVASGFNSPVFVADANDGSGRLFVMEQEGSIFVVRDGAYDDTKPFLDVSRLLTNDVFQGGYTERGLLGLAFHPNFGENGLFYITHSDRSGHLVLARYHATGDVADVDSRTELLLIDHPQYDHNGGMLAFGADGYLYMGVGDGGSQGEDPGAPAQDLNMLLGKILRLDVDGESPYAIPPDNPFVGTENAKPEIWAYGLRNPWRFSIDSATGDLYIGEVGQGEYEEIDFQAAGEGGANYGWNEYEGMHSYFGGVAPENMTLPVTEYPHTVGCSVTGGYVYRGETLPELDGVYFYGDYCSGRMWSMVRSESGRWLIEPFMETGRTISSFGQDAAGELYLVDFKGDILRLARAEQ
jgi:glucose/arabinose dehydrogenase